MKPGLWPSIDHGILSPSGKVSKRAREAALKRETEKLFPPGYWDAPAKTEAEARAGKATALRRTATNLRELADRGMTPRKFLREAARLEAEAERLEAQIGLPEEA